MFTTQSYYSTAVELLHCAITDTPIIHKDNTAWIRNGSYFIWPQPTVPANDVLFIAGPVAYWPARIHDVALLDLYCPHVTSGRLAVCYSQSRSIFSSATAFPTATLR